MAPLLPIFKKAYWSLVAGGAAYLIFLLSLLVPWIQNQALYAHAFHSGYFGYDVNQPETFGFARNQVTPFNLTTPDGETIYTWHVLPIGVYADHEAEILKQPSGPASDFLASFACRLLVEDPESRVVLSFHGNAGHIAEGQRPGTYTTLTSLHKTHLLAIDYRGFGLSSGTPSESGLISDALTLTTFALHTLRIPPHRIAIIGQSLGTAVASATALHYADPGSPLIPQSVARPPATRGKGGEGPIAFAGVVLVAPFSSLTNVVKTYRIGGIMPVLSPLRFYPSLQNWALRFVADTWPTNERIAAFVRAREGKEGGMRLSILHARNDVKISMSEGVALFSVAGQAMGRGERVGIGLKRLDNMGGVGRVRVVDMQDVPENRRREVNLEITARGGHGRIARQVPAVLAVLSAFEKAEAAWEAK